MFTEFITPIANLATAAGVIFAAAQLFLAKRQSVTDFEDQLTREYRETIRRIPVTALLGEELTDEEIQSYLSDFYNYVDLTNEQLFLRQQGRIRRDTWENWRDGIRTMMQRPAFDAAWQRIKSGAPQSFDELKRLAASNYSDDPRSWNSSHSHRPGRAPAGD